jgi:uncharacterized membrane protein HdeD (DUF308 family)
MSMNKPDIEQIQRAVATSLHEHWVLFLVEGIILIILGLAAVAIPPIATLAVEILYGWLFLISGIVGLITTFRMRQAPGFGWSLVSAILGIAVGIILLLWPLSGVLSLTLILIVFFLIEGIASIMFALDHKRELSGQWGWMLASGIIDLILATIIFAGLPGTAAWGYRATGRHQYGVRRLGADRDGAACPRDRSTFGCPGALSEAALIGKKCRAWSQQLWS